MWGTSISHSNLEVLSSHKTFVPVLPSNNARDDLTLEILTAETDPSHFVNLLVWSLVVF